MCRVLQVSVSGDSDWHKREPSRHEREDGELARQIHRIFYAKRQVYGSPRIHALVGGAGHALLQRAGGPSDAGNGARG